MHRRLSLGAAPRVEAVERPHARVDRQLLLGRAVRHVVAVRDAVAVGDDERRSRVRLGFEKGLDGLAHLRAEGHARHIHVAVHVGEQTEVLLLGRLAGRRELGHRAERRRLRLLAAGIRIDLGVEHEDVHVTLAGQDVIEAAVADVVGPPVARQPARCSSSRGNRRALRDGALQPWRAAQAPAAARAPARAAPESPLPSTGRRRAVRRLRRSPIGAARYSTSARAARA